jgi:molybdopterin adenylyltransferase
VPTGRREAAGVTPASDAVVSHEAQAPRDLGWGVLTVSSSRAEAPAAAGGGRDASGDRIAALLADAGQRLVARRLVADDRAAIGEVVAALLASDALDVVVTTGGTGVSPSDVTPEAVEPLLDRRLDGFGELFRALSFSEVGAAALLSRATAGVAGRKAVFVLPGSPAAVDLAMRRLVLPVAAHLVGQLRRGR